MMNRSTISVLASLFLVLQSGLWVNAEDVRSEEDRRVFADGLFSREIFKTAAGEYAQLLNDFPQGKDRDLLYFRLGESLRLSGDRLGALKAFLRVTQIKDAPFKHKAMFKRASIFLETDQLEISIELFDLLLLEKPADDIREMALYYKGETLSRLRRYPEAIETLEQVIAGFPKGEMAAFSKLSLGRIYGIPGDTQDLAKARACLIAVVDAPPTPRLGAEALFLLSNAEFTSGDFKSAAETFRKLETRYPEDIRVAESRRQAAWAYLNAGLYDYALKSCASVLVSTATVLEEERIEYLYIQASAYFQLVRYDDAAKAYLELVSKYPQSIFAAKSYYQLALSSYRLKQYDQAIQTLEKIMANPELRADALWLMAESAAGKGDADRSVQYYKMLVSEFPESSYAPDALYRLGHQLQLRKAWSEASVYFLQLATRFPESALAPKALFASASSLSSAREGAQALRDWDEYLRRFPNDVGVPEALFQKALEEIRMERETEALQTLDNLLVRFPKNQRLADVQFWRGQLLRKKGSMKDAEKAFRAVLSSHPSDDILRETQFSLAMVLQQDDREAEAAEIFQNLINDPVRSKFTVEQFAWLSEYQYGKKDYARAEQTARIMIEQTDDASWKQVAWTLMGRALRASNKLSEAESAFRNAEQISFNSRYLSEATLRLAEILLETGQAKDAAEKFSLAVKRCSAPELQDMRIYAYAGLARSARALNELDSAARYFMTVCLLYKSDEIIPPVLVETITLLDELNRSDEADAMRQELLSKYPESKEAIELVQALEGGE